MPGLEAVFRQRVMEAIKLAEIGETARAESMAGSLTRQEFYYHRIEFLYEMAYLRIYLAWETFLEDTFQRYLCGYTSKAGRAAIHPGKTYCSTLANAEKLIIGKYDYVLWHNPSRVVKRSDKFFKSSPIAKVIHSYTSRLDDLAAIRHRIAHSQDNARRKFDSATMTIAGRRYRGSRAGAFLRDRDCSVHPHMRWLDKLGRELTGLAAQIA